MAAQQRRKRPRDDAFETPIQTIRLFRNPPVIPDKPLTVKSISSRLWRALRGHGKDAYHVTQFLRGMPWETDKEQQEWRAWRFLGAGGHGAAAVWIKIDEKGNLLDEIVLKEQRNPSHHFLFQGFPQVSSEAVLHNMVNVNDECENIVHLRDFKAHLGQEPKNEVWRFYLEYAPHGNLENLRLRYRAFHRYMPEHFLWHVFNSLAKAISALDDVPDDRGYIIHADIKPDNVFLGYEEIYDQSKPTGGLRTGEYPTIKLGDFGCARMAKEEESIEESFFKFINRGTPGYYPPEQPLSERGNPWGYGHAFDPPVNDGRPKMTAKANVWQVGKVMYDLFSLSGQEKYESLQAKSGHEYHEVNRHDTLPNWVTTPFVEDLYRQKSPYSTKLSETISRCMAANPTQRPSAEQLYQETLSCLRTSMRSSESLDPVSVRNTRLYYRGNEINNMRIDEMNCYHGLVIWDYFRLLEPANNDPDEPRLNIHPEQTRDTLVGLEDSEDDIAGVYDREVEDQIKAYDWRNHEVQQGRIRRHDSRIFFENIQPDRPPSPNKSYSSSSDTNSDKDEDFDNISKRDMKRRRLNSIANRNRIASRQLRERKKQERQAVERQLQAAEQQRQEAELPSNTSHPQVDGGDHESRTPARGMTPMRHIDEMGQALMPPTTSITTQAPAKGQARPRPGLDHLTPDIAPSRPDWARFGLSPSSGVFEQDAPLEVYGADTVQAVPPTGAIDPNYVSPRTPTALHKRAGFPPEPNRPRPVATPGVVRPSYKRDKSEHEAGTSVFRGANVPQQQQDDPIPSIETNHPSGNAVAQTSRADARGVGLLAVSSSLDRAPSVTRVRTPSDDPKTSRVLRSLSENASTGETPEAYHRDLQAQIHGRDTVQQGTASRGRSRSAQAEDGPAATPGQPIVQTSAPQQGEHLVPTMQPDSNASNASATASAPAPARGGRGSGRGRGRGRGRQRGRGQPPNAAPRGGVQGRTDTGRDTGRTRATPAATANARNAERQMRERIVDEQGAARAARAAQRALR